MTASPNQGVASVVAINHDDRDVFDRALRNARTAAFPPGEFVGQESFMQGSEILRLAAGAEIVAGTSVLDLCCGVGGPGLLIAERTGCAYHGIDASRAAVRIARARADDLDCRFDVAEIPPVPQGRFDVVMLLETLLAFPDKQDLLRHVRDVLPIGGRFAFTVEAGEPLSEAERDAMPESQTVWPVPLSELLSCLDAVGLQVISSEDSSRSHGAIAQRLHDEFVADAQDIAQAIGSDALDSLLAAHRLWCEWLECGRIRKLAFVTLRR